MVLLQPHFKPPFLSHLFLKMNVTFLFSVPIASMSYVQVVLRYPYCTKPLQFALNPLHWEKAAMWAGNNINLTAVEMSHGLPFSTPAVPNSRRCAVLRERTCFDLFSSS